MSGNFYDQNETVTIIPSIIFSRFPILKFFGPGFIKNFFSKMAQISDMGERGNFGLLIWQKSYQGIVLGPTRGSIGSLTPLWVSI